ncbi:MULTISPECIES: FAD-dependent oxidoreductase [unclassified Halomonas]|uniref:FAD-dependent oxidoreductase n=1 Tax=unclassified Halomonas TaxID=2609666 RepID=UPI0028867E9C|nr:MULTISPECIES: FAD-dependent oxidoreductase [unclassified Halomonas]MDT0500674.1 FAD-dependent oxidoreductase [Halomonas sp. PAR7]MDT0513135.1 FAD-dependent oxidoreductase [Halomonas sp. LES1]MDT0591454.1 FAD-dependent oxidoreductase [Halomonas sp. PAR8]
MSSHRLLLLLLIAALVVAFFLSGANDYLTLEVLQAEQARFHAWLSREPVTVIGGFFLLYVAMAALSLPGAALMTVLSGTLFGLGGGLLLVSFASTIGATLAALIARTLLRGPLERRYARQLERINAGIRREGALYLFTLRLIPLFPFFVINLVVGLTRMRLSTFYWVSQLGMLPGTVVFVNAGSELADLESLGDILSPSLLLSFVLIGLFPWLARGVVAVVRRRALARRYRRPGRFDRDIVVIGAGAAGLVASYIGAAVRARVTLVERERMGGDCLNTGCVPSKALIRAARSVREIRRAGRYGVRVAEPRVDFAAVMAHVHGAIESIEPHDSPERYRGLGVDVLEGDARLTSPWEVRVATPEGERTLTTRQVIIASGARPRVPELPGIEAVKVLTSDNLWQLDTLPERLVVLGGGPIGCELGQSLAMLGSRVTLVESAEQLLPREDAEVARELEVAMEEEGVQLLLGHRALRVVADVEGHVLEVADADDSHTRLPLTHLLVAVGREANVTGMGLEALGVETRQNGTLEVDETLRSVLPNVWACGDVVGPYQLTHAGAHQAWHATVNALFGEVKRFRVSYQALPAVTFTTPEIARVGLNEREAREKGVDVEVTRYSLAELDRALAEDEARGFVKVLTRPGSDRILGASIVGAEAGEMLATFTLAMTRGIGLNRLLSTIHPYPTRSEAVKAAAGVWKNAHKPERLLGWLARYFAWRRGEREPSRDSCNKESPYA